MPESTEQYFASEEQIRAFYPEEERNYQEYECLGKLEGHNGWVLSVFATTDGKIISGSEDGTIRIWGEKED